MKELKNGTLSFEVGKPINNEKLEDVISDYINNYGGTVEIKLNSDNGETNTLKLQKTENKTNINIEDIKAISDNDFKNLIQGFIEARYPDYKEFIISQDISTNLNLVIKY